jgi:hypothetical protein
VQNFIYYTKERRENFGVEAECFKKNILTNKIMTNEPLDGVNLSKSWS